MYSFQGKEKDNHSHHFLEIQNLIESSNKYNETSKHKGVRISRGRKIFHSRKTNCRKSKESIDKPLQLIKEFTKLLIQKSQYYSCKPEQLIRKCNKIG